MYDSKSIYTQNTDLNYRLTGKNRETGFLPASLDIFYEFSLLCIFLMILIVPTFLFYLSIFKSFLLNHSDRKPDQSYNKCCDPCDHTLP